MRKFPGSALLLVCSLSSVPAAHAQMDPPYDPAVDVQLFEYAVGPKSFFSVDDGGVTTAKQFTADAMFTFMTDPFVIYDVDEVNDEIIRTRTEVVKNLLAGELGAAYGLSSRLQIGLSLPLVLSMSGDGLDPATARPAMDGLQSTGLGDLRLEGKYLISDRPNLRLAGIGGVTVPTSFGAGGGDYLGDDLPTGRARLAVQWIDRGGKITAGANAGIILRKPRTIYSSEIGQQFTYSAALSYRISEKVAAIGETFGRSGFAFDVDSSPLEVAGGIRLRATPAVSVVIGGGAGVVSGIGSPGLRAFLAIGWAPDYRDTDRDGVGNDDDRCVLVPEDRDGFEDRDGCPDNDNDKDLRPDAEDKCPDQREDIDGFDDEDGCPELDNDKDGLEDGKDKCPTDAEDGKPPYEKDGCPSTKRDSDSDGVADAYDACPTEEEDEDEFEDWDGCPDADNDKDGIGDAADSCRNCAEDLDMVDDEDGCPDVDAADPRIARLDGDRVVFGKEPGFDRQDQLTAQGKKVAAHLAGLMSSHPEVNLWILAVAARTKAQADKMGANLKQTLVALGVNGDTVTVLTTVGAPKVGVIVRDRRELTEDEQKAEMQCPPEYQAKPREKPATPEAAMPPEPAPAPAPVAVEEPEMIDMDPPPPPAPVVTGPVDSDGDGLLDDIDLCDAEAGPAEAKGCPDTDRDGDGVADRLDNCPDEKGKAANSGCAVKQLVVISGDKIEIKQQVFFKLGKAVIERKSFKLLDNVAKVIVAHPEIPTIVVEGHTDNAGDDAANLNLSQARADAVRVYLIAKMVAPERLQAVGYGETKPIADNKSKRGREKNRRVELKVVISTP